MRRERKNVKVWIVYMNLLIFIAIFIGAQNTGYAMDWSQNTSGDFNIEGRYVARSYETRLNTEEPSEGYDPYKITRLYIDKKDGIYRLMLTIEQLKTLADTIATFDYYEGQTEFVATVGDHQGCLCSGDKIWFQYDGADFINVQWISSSYRVYEGLVYGGGYQKIEGNVNSLTINDPYGLSRFYIYRNGNIRSDEAYRVLSGYLIKKDVPGYWSLVDEERTDVLEVWEHWPTGSKGKVTVDLKTGVCYEEAPYWGVDIPYEEIPLERNYLFNIYDYLYFYEENNFWWN